MIKKPRIYYGWWIVLTGFLSLFMGAGMIAYGRTIFFKAMFTDMGWLRGDLALAMSLGMVFSAFLQPVVGTWVDKHGASRLMAGGAFLYGSALMLCSQIRQLWHAFLIFPLFNVSVVTLTIIPTSTMISNWFVEKRGRAMGMAMAGIGMGGFVLSPLITFLIGEIGWRMSWVVMGVMMWVIVIPPALLIIKPSPESMGLLPDGKLENAEETALRAEKAATSSPTPGISIRGILGIANFWLLAAVYVLTFAAEGGILAHTYSLFTDRGITAAAAGTMLGAIGLCSLLGKLTLSYLTERFTIKSVLTGAIMVECLGILVLLAAPPAYSWGFVILYGLNMGGIVALRPLFIGSCFDRAFMGKTMGLIMMFSSLLAGVPMPAVVGYIYDTQGSYNIALVLAIGFLLAASVIAQFIRPVTGRGSAQKAA